MSKSYEKYLKSGKKLTLNRVNGKIPMLKNWGENFPTYNDIVNHLGNYSWVLSDNDLVIDVDPRNGGFDSFEKLCNDFPSVSSIKKTVQTPSGGYHYYLSKPNDLKTTKTLSDYPGVDFLTKGSLCTIVGSTIDNKKYSWFDESLGFFQDDAPQELLDLLFVKPIEKPIEKVIENYNFNKHTVDEIIKMLNVIDPSCGHDEWLKVGMALHDWNSEKGLELWDEWSQKGNNYKEGEPSNRWKSFGNSNDLVTMGTLKYINKKYKFDNLEKLFNDISEEIKRSDLKTIKLSIIPKIKKAKFNEVYQEALIKKIKNQFQHLEGIKVKIDSIRSLFNNNEIETSKANFSFNKWVYVNSHRSYFNLNNFSEYKTEAFNLTLGNVVPKNKNGNKVSSASKYVADNGLIDVVEYVDYLPAEKTGLFKNDAGDLVLNIFNSNTLPQPTDNISSDGEKAISLLLQHIDLICSYKKEYSEILLQWLAHQVQFPGKKILWVPLIQGIQGIGKSYFGKLLRLVLGSKNVGTIAPEQVTSSFNGWAIKKLVNVLDELKIKGHSRYEAVNSLKPLITDDVIQINEKGVNQYYATNVTNYICFTNFKDCVPIEDDDRRFWVIFAPLSSLNDIYESFNIDYKVYFHNLFESTKKHYLEIKRFLLDYKISDDFKNMKWAPDTSFKESMKLTEQTSIDGFSTIYYMLHNSTSVFYNTSFIFTRELFADFEVENNDIFLSPRQKNNILKALKFTKEKRIKLKDTALQDVWVASARGSKELEIFIDNYKNE